MKERQEVHAAVLEGHERCWRVVLDGFGHVPIDWQSAAVALCYAQKTQWATARVMRMVKIAGEWKEEACEGNYYRTSDGRMWPVGGKRSARKRNTHTTTSHGDSK